MVASDVEELSRLLSDELTHAHSNGERDSPKTRVFTPVERMRGHQIADLLLQMISDLPVGHRVGTKLELRDSFGFALATINEALRALRAQGRVKVRSGPGGGVDPSRK